MYVVHPAEEEAEEVKDDCKEKEGRKEGEVFSQSRLGVGRSAGKGGESGSKDKEDGGIVSCPKSFFRPLSPPLSKIGGGKRRRLQPSLPPNPPELWRHTSAEQVGEMQKWEEDECLSNQVPFTNRRRAEERVFSLAVVWCGSWRLLVRRRRRCRYAPRSSLWPPCGFGGGGGGFKSSLHRERLSSLEEWA